MEENELDDLFSRENPPDAGNELLKSIERLTQRDQDIRNVIHKNKKQIKQNEDPYGLDFSNISKTDLYSGSNSLTGADKPLKFEMEIDRIKDASNESLNSKRILNEKGEYEGFNPDDWRKSALSFLGFNGFTYEKSVAKEKESTGLQATDIGGGNNAWGFGLFDDVNQERDFLIPTVDPTTGKNILRRVRGTYKDVVKKGYNPLNVYGASEESELSATSFLKSFTNTLYQSDDVILGATKYIQDLGLYLTGNSDVETKLDELYEDTAKETERTDFILSQEANEFGSLEWLTSGTGSALASLTQFGGVGRGIRAGVSGAEGLTKAFGGGALKEVVANKVATYGSSGVIGFGYAYNEAIQNGLSDGEALTYGAVVGSLNSAIEMWLGKDFDKFLTGGGPKVIAKDIIRELNGKVTPESLAGFMKQNGKALVESMGARFKNFSTEGAEEVLQDVVEQGSKLAFNAAYADNDAVKGDGKFNIHEFDFTQTISAGLFGGIAGGMFNHTKRMANYIAEGKGEDVKTAIDLAYTQGDITLRQQKELKKEHKILTESFNLNKNLLEGITGEFAQPIRQEAETLIRKRKTYQDLQSQLTEGLRDKSPEQAEKAKLQIEGLDKHIAELDTAISKFGNEDFLKERVAALKEQKESMIENKNNVFGRIAAATSYDVDQTKDDTYKRIGTLPGETLSKQPIARTATEANYVLELIDSGKIDASVAPVFVDQIRKTKMLYSPLINAMENRESLLKIGITEDELPLTREEKADAVTNPEKYQNRYVSADAFNVMIDMVPGDASRIDKIKYLISDESAKLNDAQIHSLDNREKLAEYLRPEQLKALATIHNVAMPTSIILTGGETDATGFFENSSRMIVVDGVTDKLDALKGSNENEAEVKRLQDHLFHVLAHETGHGLFNRELRILHDSWLKSLAPNAKLGSRDAMNATYFNQLLGLTRVAHEGLSKKSGAKHLYFFNTVARNFGKTPPTDRPHAALEYVREFFAETFSNERQQILMESFDMNDPKNKVILDQHGYTYKKPDTAGKETLLGQAIKAVSSVFQRLKKVLDRNDRTILSEAFTLGSRLDYNRFYATKIEAKEKPSLTEMSISNYEGVNIFAGEEIDRDELLASLYRRLQQAGARLDKNSHEELLDKVQAFVDKEIFNTDVEEYLGGSLAVVYFKASDSFMIMWRTVGENGGEDNYHRAFFDKYGNEMPINTNTSNYFSPTKLSKPVIFDAFKHTGSLADHKRKVINNLERAIAENFSGEAFLEYDPSHTWEFNGKEISGQVNIVYKSKEWTGIVGYAPDLAKVRLSHLLTNGANIKVSLSKANENGGSRALVKRDENGDLIDVKRINELLNPVGYQEAIVSPIIHFRYEPTSNVSDTAVKIANSVDTITTDDAKLEPRISKNDLTFGHDRLFNGSYDVNFDYHGFSLYNPDGLDIEPGSVDARVQYVRDGLSRFMRRVLYFSDNKNLVKDTLDDITRIYNEKYASKYILENTPESLHANSARFGFDNDTDFIEFVDGVYEDVSAEWRKSGSIAKEDWVGLGGNPSGRISDAIKADIEALSYEDGNKKVWIDFSDARTILLEAAERTKSYNEMIENLRTKLDKKVYGGKKKAIAQSVYNHLSKDRTEETPENIKFKSVENSYWSQFGSYIRLDARTVMPDGNGVRVFVNGEKSHVEGKSQEIAGSIESKIYDVIDSIADGDSAPDSKAIMAKLKSDMNNFFVSRYTQKLIKRGMAEQEAAQVANNALLTQSGKQSDVISMIVSSFKSKYDIGKFNVKGYSTSGIASKFKDNFFEEFQIEKPGQDQIDARNDYNRAAEMIDAYFAFFGIELPGVLFDISKNIRNIQYLLQKRAKLISEGMSFEAANNSVLRAMKDMEINSYSMIPFKPKGSSRIDEYPFVFFASHLVDFIGFQMQKHVSGKDFDYNVGELTELSKALLNLEGGYRSPEFYHNANLEKEWSIKYKSYSDSLVEDLSAEDSKMLKEYLSAPIYANNRFLQTIKEIGGKQRIQNIVGGIKSQDDYSKNSSYEGAGDLDFTYMNIAEYIANYRQGSGFYAHIDDVPSDKPRNMSFLIARVNPSELKNEIEKIIATEKVRFDEANERFNGAFTPTDFKVDGKWLFEVGDQKEFDSLIPGVHYQQVKHEGKIYFQEGWVFDKKNYFYGGGTTNEIASTIEAESIRSYQDLRKQGMNFPVPTQFLIDLNDKYPDHDSMEYKRDLAAEQERIFKEWRINYIINRYHLNQVLMGDYIYYKQDKFSDLNKRHAGTVAPSVKGVFERPTMKVAVFNDVTPGERDGLLKRTVKNENTGQWEVDLNPENDINLNDKINRTDAQGYVTERFAEEIKKAYGSLSSYEKIFKPVVYGIDRKNIKNAQPIYLKLSLSTLPDPGTEEAPLNVNYYGDFPNQLSFARKLYDSGADFATFRTGVKVGINTINNVDDSEYKTFEFDSNLFGLQNDPYHDPNADDNVIEGGVQQTKQLGDNGNFESIMSVYHEIEGKLVDREVQDFLDKKMGDQASIRQTVKEALDRNDHSAPIADFMDADVRTLDNPITARFAENVLNAQYKNAIALYSKDGEKLVNVSELGMGRPRGRALLETRKVILEKLNMPVTEYSYDLAWAGPRTPQDLTIDQLEELERELEAGTKTISDSMYITDADGNVVIYPTEILVPEGNYKIGDRAIATRIPTSKKSSSIPSVVVGHTHESQGNIIAVGKPGTAVLGFDFDVDGLFVWRENKKENHPINKMFGIAFQVLTSPMNYEELVSPTVTDDVAALAEMVDELRSEGDSEQKVKYSQFSPERQIEFKKLNSVGKVMIGVTAYSYGIHSVLEQNDGSPYTQTETNDRSYLFDNNQRSRRFSRMIVDDQGNQKRVTDVYSEMLNAAADNAKLQYLGRINANPTVSSVFFDMISHGASLEYAGLFVNQPVIREFVRMTENQNSASYVGNKPNVGENLKRRIEAQIKKLGDVYVNYEFDQRDAKGNTVPESKAITHTENGKQPKKIKMDKVSLSVDTLKDGIRKKYTSPVMMSPLEQRFTLLENQLVVLDKFLYYKSLSNISSNAGKLTSLTSGYPKTYIELIDTKSKIDAALLERQVGVNKNGEPIIVPAPIEISGLVQEHGMYKVHYSRMNDLIEAYEKSKLYANPVLREMHNDIAGGKSTELQNKVHDAFYTQLLTQENESDNDNFVYNLSTSSLTGEVIDPYNFVHYSAVLINELKKELPTNEFLRLLKVDLVEDARLIANKAVAPSQVTINIGTDPDGEMLTRIRAAFKSLPKNFKYFYNEIVNGESVTTETTINSTQDIVLGHLLYTQGMRLGGFSFSKLLPVETAKFFDRSVEITESRINSFQELNPIEETDQNNPESKNEYLQSLLDDAALNEFPKLVRMNNPELIRTISQEQWDAATKSDTGHFEQWSANTVDKSGSTHYQGAVARKVRDDKGETILLQWKPKNAENKTLINDMIKQGLVRVNDRFGKPKIFSVSAKQKVTVDKFTALYIQLDEVNFVNYPNLKRYGSYFTDELSAAAISERKNQILSDEELLEPISLDEIDAPVAPKHKVVSGLVDLVNTREERQTAVFTEGNPGVSIGDIVAIPAGEESVLVGVKKVWDANDQYQKALNKYGDQATAKMLEWASRITGQQQTLADVLDKSVIEFVYTATVDADGHITHRSAERTFSQYNPNSSFSDYNPKKSSGMYKSIMLKTGQMLKVLRAVPVVKGGEAEFFDSLRILGLDAIQRQIISDYIANNNVENSNTNEISDGLIAIANSGDTLEHYNTAAGFDRHTETPLEKFHEVSVAILGPQFEEASQDFSTFMDKVVSDDEIMINPNTALPYTYYEWLVHHYDLFIKEERMMREIEGSFGGDLNQYDFTELKKAYKIIRQDMKAADHLIWKKNIAFIEKLGHHLGARSEARSFDIINKRNETPGTSYAQSDIKTWDEELRSVADFTEQQAAMQEVGRHISIAALGADAEKLRTNAKMNRLMAEVKRYHLEGKPKEFSDSVNPKKIAKQNIDIFGWMLEFDENGEPTGKMIARYAETEKFWRDRAFERRADESGEKVYFNIPNKIIFDFIKRNASGNLTAVEIKMIKEIGDKYNDYKDFGALYQTLTDVQKDQCGKDTTLIRNMWVKIHVKSQDSEAFVKLKNEAKMFKGTSVGKLAQAKINLYDYLYEKSNELLQETGYFHFPVERGLMPMMSSDINETWARYGFSRAKDEFLSSTKDDIDAVQTQHGMVVSVAPIMSFNNTKKVPYRTLQEKENFSINVPAIFEHHFNSLIFKKHYDEVLPIMDAVQVYYKMQQSMGAGKFENLQKFISEYAEQKIFMKKRDAAKSVGAKATRFVSSMTVTAFMGLAPVSSAINWLVGNTETMKHLMGDYGFGEGLDKFRKGFERMYSVKDITRYANEEFLMDPKALAIMDHYGVETFVKSEIQNVGNIGGRVQDALLILQKNGEIMIRGASLFAQMSDEQWDAFTLNADGSLNVGPKAPKPEQVAEWKNSIESVQGKYSDELKRLYHGNIILQSAFLFKGWLVDYIRSRAGNKYFDQYGKEREGYWRTGVRLAFGSQETNGAKIKNISRYLESLQGKDVLTNLEQQNLRKIYFDLATFAFLTLIGGAIGALGGDDDREEDAYRKYLGKISGQLFLLADPVALVGMAKQPFAVLHYFEQTAKIIDGIFTLNLKQVTDAGYSMLPGRQAIELTSSVIEAVSDESENEE